MSDTLTLPRIALRSWTLYDPSGVIHGTCQAHNFREAAYILKLSDTQADKGWVIARS